MNRPPQAQKSFVHLFKDGRGWGQNPHGLPLRGRRARHKKRQQNLGTYIPKKVYACYGEAKPRTPS